jgi:uncharacterized glyoxalase superfamily protein PhnB
MRILQSTLYLRVSDMQRSLAFYVDGLGFEVTSRMSEGGELFWARLSKDGCSLMISDRPSRFVSEGQDSEHEHDAEGRHLFSGVAVAPAGELNLVTFLYVDDVDAAYEDLRARGIDVEEAPEDRFYGLREMLVRDPDGYYYAIATQPS